MAEGKNSFEVEHIWSNHPEQHTDEFDNPTEFSEQRNRIGDLLLLPKSFNASYSDLRYEEKLPYYNSQNLLARSLHPQAYERNPRFLRFVEQSKVPFRALPRFKRAEIDYRQDLYRQLAKLVSNLEDLIREVGQ